MELSLTDMLEHVGDDLKGLRDRAILSFGFAAACRRSELAALTVDHVAEVDQGLIVTIERSKTDQEAQDRRSPCPVERGPARCWRVAFTPTALAEGRVI